MKKESRFEYLDDKISDVEIDKFNSLLINNVKQNAVYPFFNNGELHAFHLGPKNRWFIRYGDKAMICYGKNGFLHGQNEYDNWKII